MCLCNITCTVYVIFSLFSFNLNVLSLSVLSPSPFPLPPPLASSPPSSPPPSPPPPQDYYRSGHMLVRMLEAIGRLVLAGRDMAHLSGFTAHIHQLTTVLRDLHKGRYVRTMVNTRNTGANGTTTSGESLVTGNGTGEYKSLIMHPCVHVCKLINYACMHACVHVFELINYVCMCVFIFALNCFYNVEIKRFGHFFPDAVEGPPLLPGSGEIIEVDN